jgi:hypothetical protein
MSEVRYAFVLRVWFKRESASLPLIRGSLQLANSDQVYYFASLDEVPALLQRLIDWPHSPSATDKHEKKEK